MLDTLLGRLFAPLLEAIGRRLSGVAGVLALAGFLTGLGAAGLIAWRQFWIGLAVFTLSRIVSAVAARASAEQTPAIAVFDAVAFAALPFAFALSDPVRALPAVFLMFALAALTAATARFGKALIADTELFVALAVACVMPAWFAIVAYITGLLCFVAAGAVLARRPA